MRDAIIEKWLTYVKSENLTEFVMWRMMFMHREFSIDEGNKLKVVLKERRKEDEAMVTEHENNKGKFSKNYNSYGNTISKIFPLLDPDFTQKKRLEKHGTWF